MFSLRFWWDQRVQDSLLSASYVQSPVVTAVLFRTSSPRRHFSPTYDNSIDMHVKHGVIFLFVCLFVWCSAHWWSIWIQAWKHSKIVLQLCFLTGGKDVSRKREMKMHRRKRGKCLATMQDTTCNNLAIHVAFLNGDVSQGFCYFRLILWWSLYPIHKMLLKSHEEDIKQFSPEGTNHDDCFGVIFPGTAWKHSIFNPCPSLRSVPTDDRRQFSDKI